MTPYTDQMRLPKDEPATSPSSTEKAIEARGLTIGRRAKISTLKDTASRHWLCIGSLVSILCLFFLLRHSTANSIPKFPPTTNPSTADKAPTPIIAPTKPSAEAGDNNNNSPKWAFTGYTDDKCFNETISDSGTGSIDCKDSTEDLGAIDFDGQHLYTLSLYQGLKCATLLESYPNGKFSCAAGFKATSYKVVLNKKLGSCDPDACKQRGSEMPM